MKVAAIQHHHGMPWSFEAFQEKLTATVEKHNDADLLVLPEYVCQAPLDVYVEFFSQLSKLHQMYICSGTMITEDNFNRAFLFSPTGAVATQDKCFRTPGELQDGIAPGRALNLIQTPFGKLGICICYDIEFPALAKAFVDGGATLLVVPSFTASVHGYYRVFLSCRARAIENQCFVVQSALIGPREDEVGYGAAAICSPCDPPFPEEGLLALGARDESGVVVATLDFGGLEWVRERGETRNFSDAQTGKTPKITYQNLGV